MISTTVRMIRDCFKPSPKKAGPAVPLLKLWPGIFNKNSGLWMASHTWGYSYWLRTKRKTSGTIACPAAPPVIMEQFYKKWVESSVWYKSRYVATHPCVSTPHFNKKSVTARYLSPMDFLGFGPLLPSEEDRSRSFDCCFSSSERSISDRFSSVKDCMMWFGTKKHQAAKSFRANPFTQDRLDREPKLQANVVHRLPL